MRKCEMIRAVIPISPFLPLSLFSSLFSFLFACVNNIGALFLSFTLANPMTGVGVALEDARPCCCCSTAAVNFTVTITLSQATENKKFLCSLSGRKREITAISIDEIRVCLCVS
ncbi:hypothetical protein FRC20_003641 [Serendipita sp. 405]|nr:hypothetical protein FRC20_003641 [Serendipita sp. 405]